MCFNLLCFIRCSYVFHLNFDIAMLLNKHAGLMRWEKKRNRISQNVSIFVNEASLADSDMSTL